MTAHVVDVDLITYGEPVDVTRILSYTETARVDLHLPVLTVEYYRLFPEPPVPSDLFDDIRANGIRSPLRIYTNGVKGVLRDGHHRLYIARMLGFKTVPVHVIPNWLEKVYVGYGLPDLERILQSWLADNDDSFTHVDHVQKRKECNERMTAVTCSCGAGWREMQ